jgi:hypothetical protein
MSGNLLGPNTIKAVIPITTMLVAPGMISSPLKAMNI